MCTYWKENWFTKGTLTAHTYRITLLRTPYLALVSLVWASVHPKDKMTRRHMGVHTQSSILLSSRIGKDESAEGKEGGRSSAEAWRGVRFWKGEAGRGGEVMVGWWGVTEGRRRKARVREWSWLMQVTSSKKCCLHWFTARVDLYSVLVLLINR